MSRPYIVSPRAAMIALQLGTGLEAERVAVSIASECVGLPVSLKHERLARAAGDAWREWYTEHAFRRIAEEGVWAVSLQAKA